MISKKFKATPLEQLNELRRAAVEMIPEDDLLKKLEVSYQSGKPLIVKFGADPSRPDIHLGHTVVMNQLRILQDFGHEVNFLIGDFTAQIGDPTGRSKTRQQLTANEVQKNSKTYQDQIFKVLNPEKTQVIYNSRWLNSIDLSSFLQILMSTTVGQLLAREDFTSRFRAEEPIFLHEFLYPLLQGYDSVVMKADLELGGTDQKFNLLMGRHLQKYYGLPQQAILIMPLLEGLDGVQKMSKSLDNFIALTDSPKDMFGKIMSISDLLMIRYYELLSMRPSHEIDKIKLELKEGKLHPMSVKKQLGIELVDLYHGLGTGTLEKERFEDLFSKKSLSIDLPVLQVHVNEQGKVNLITLMVEQGFVQSRSEARRLLQQNAVKIDGQSVTEEYFQLKHSGEQVLRVGKLHQLKLMALPI